MKRNLDEQTGDETMAERKSGKSPRGWKHPRIRAAGNESCVLLPAPMGKPEGLEFGRLDEIEVLPFGFTGDGCGEPVLFEDSAHVVSPEHSAAEDASPAAQKGTEEPRSSTAEVPKGANLEEPGAEVVNVPTDKASVEAPKDSPGRRPRTRAADLLAMCSVPAFSPLGIPPADSVRTSARAYQAKRRAPKCAGVEERKEEKTKIFKAESAGERKRNNGAGSEPEAEPEAEAEAEPEAEVEPEPEREEGEGRKAEPSPSVGTPEERRGSGGGAAKGFDKLSALLEFGGTGRNKSGTGESDGALAEAGIQKRASSGGEKELLAETGARKGTEDVSQCTGDGKAPIREALAQSPEDDVRRCEEGKGKYPREDGVGQKTDEDSFPWRGKESCEGGSRGGQSEAEGNREACEKTERGNERFSCEILRRDLEEFLSLAIEMLGEDGSKSTVHGTSAGKEGTFEEAPCGASAKGHVRKTEVTDEACPNRDPTNLCDLMTVEIEELLRRKKEELLRVKESTKGTVRGTEEDATLEGTSEKGEAMRAGVAAEGTSKDVQDGGEKPVDTPAEPEPEPESKTETETDSGIREMEVVMEVSESDGDPFGEDEIEEGSDGETRRVKRRLSVRLTRRATNASEARPNFLRSGRKYRRGCEFAA